MKPCVWSVLVLIILAVPAQLVGADSELDRYFALRRQHQSNTLQISQVKANPESFHGRVLELRGTLSGSARGGEGCSFIIDTGDGCYIVWTEDPVEIGAGSKIAVLVQVGDKCAMSLNDLRLLCVAYQGEVVERETKAIQAEAAKKARQAVIQSSSKPEDQSRFKRGDKATSRSGNPESPEELVTIYKKAIQKFNKKLSDSEADTIARSILGFSAKYEVDPRLVVAVIIAESNFRPEAKSKAGAMGLGQLMPGTAAGLGVSDPYDVVENVGGSVRLIKGHLDRLSGGAPWTELTWNDLSLALASYNAGPGAVKKYGGVPPYRETQNYIKKVFSVYKRLCGVQ